MTAMHLGVNTLFHVPGDVGGTETYLQAILRSLVDEYQDLSLTLFTHNDNDHVMRDWLGVRSNIDYRCLPVNAHIRPFRILAEQTLLPFYVKNSGVELLWSPGYTAPYFSHCPQAVTIHDLQYKKYPQDMRWLERITLDRLVKIACNRCSGVITVSRFARREIINSGFASSDKVHAILEGVSPLFAVPVEDREIEKELRRQIPQDKPFILCVAHTYPHKNVHLLVEAFRHVEKIIPHNLVLVGRPRLGEPEVEEAIDKLDRPQRLFRLKGGVSFDLLRLLYQKADLFVLPSGYEGFGLPVLEAMMAGVLVVCSQEASLPEVGGNHAIYAGKLTVQAVADQIVVALEMTAEEKAERRREAKKWAKGFSWQRSARETFTILGSMNRA